MLRSTGLASAEVENFIFHFSVFTLQIVYPCSIAHLQSSINDGTVGIENTVLACASTVGCYLTACINAVPVNLETDAVCTLLGSGELGARNGRTGVMASPRELTPESS